MTNNSQRKVLCGKSTWTHSRHKRKKEQLWKLKLAQLIINDLQNYGPSNIYHVKALSVLTQKPIRVWLPGGNLYKIINGARRNENAATIDIEYHNVRSTNQRIGHWTLMGNNEPVNIKPDLNRCLFNVIAAQTGNNPVKLRFNTIRYLKNNINALIDQFDSTLSSYDKKETTLLIGGARYHGKSPTAAGIILDRSQNIYCHNCTQKGHPRGHTSDKNATGPLDSVENYSRTGFKSGFLSRADQNNVAHFALIHRNAVDAMENLNKGVDSQSVSISARDLQILGCELPQMMEWRDGKEISGLLNIQNILLVLRHHEGKYDDPDADVFVHTFYPKSY
ncbi:uncharacterized protein LOC117220450 [Megalopta genalis]|uniref:uncharacterized protein LOC117220450 n=1 Tax=Megalopta genalis TaxID=115081 RepID=UPI003FD53312